MECSARNIWEAGTAGAQVVCPDRQSIQLVEPAPAHWQNERFRFSPESGRATPAQRAELIRRDGYRCKTPEFPHHLFLKVHHIKSYSEQGQTPDGLFLRDARGRFAKMNRAR